MTWCLCVGRREQWEKLISKQYCTVKGRSGDDVEERRNEREREIM